MHDQEPQDGMTMDPNTSPKTMPRDWDYPMYPTMHSEEAHMRANYLREEIDMLDGTHEQYMEAYKGRRNELQLMLDMCHHAIDVYDQATAPQNSMPMSQVPGRSSQPPDRRSPYDTGMRPPSV